ncbi:MAG TPA: ribbon-helix-helix protein, CopG family [Thiobacillus sp.]|nr:MAG: CopG family transcriptional regulator [Hydrogenophilales bacterium 28-61-11]OYZ55914.1 MAG: CopG family transcriptional regulator [Hydrogenophilales bacterium 16-61-112]HQT32099.1 ribbon-helix-helix protein, CopG family [Thiobacillus sp.]HQT71883.1 ribbon-helix-helix protein, CopG family [Thiobacillus sp.]
MATSVLTLRIDESIKARLDELAQATHRSKSFLAEEAIVRYLELEAWQVGEIRQAIQEADQGDFAEPSELAALLKKYAG